eukprot:SAG31_NODE_4208_length_3473_cov_2.441612_6_plen_35_part_00
MATCEIVVRHQSDASSNELVSNELCFAAADAWRD